MDLGTVIAIILSELDTGQNENNKVKKSDLLFKA